MNTMMNFETQAMAPRFTSSLLVPNASSGAVAQFHGDGWRPADGAAHGAVAAFNLSVRHWPPATCRSLSWEAAAKQPRNGPKMRLANSFGQMATFSY